MTNAEIDAEILTLEDAKYKIKKLLGALQVCRNSRNWNRDKMLKYEQNGLLLDVMNERYPVVKLIDTNHEEFDINRNARMLWKEGAIWGVNQSKAFTEWCTDNFRRSYPKGVDEALWFINGYKPQFEKKHYTTEELLELYQKEQ